MENQTIDVVFQLEAQAAALKQKQRQIALDYTKKIISSFSFSIEDLFENKRDNFRSGAIAICRKIIADQPDIGRHEFMEKAVASGVSKATASTQFSRLKK